MIPGRGAAAGDQDVGAAGAVGRRGDGAHLIDGDAKVDGFRAPAGDRGGQRESVGADDLIRAGDGARRDELIAGGKDGDSGPAEHGDFTVAGRGQEAEVAGGQHLSLGDERLALAEVQARAPDEPALGSRLADEDLAILLLGVLLQGDDVGPVRNRGAGEDAHAGAGLHRPWEVGARPGLSDLPQAQRKLADVLGPQRIAVHGRHRDRRMAEPG